MLVGNASERCMQEKKINYLSCNARRRCPLYSISCSGNQSMMVVAPFYYASVGQRPSDYGFPQICLGNRSLNRTFNLWFKVLTLGFPQICLGNRSLNRTFKLRF